MKSFNVGSVTVQGDPGKSRRMIFNHDGKQRCAACKTTDEAVARNIATFLDRIIKDNLFLNPPADTPARVREILNLPRPEFVSSPVALTTAYFLQDVLIAFQKSRTPPPISTPEFMTAIQKHVDEYRLLEARLYTANETIATLTKQLNEAEKRASGYEGLRIKEGLRVIKSFEKVTLKQAVDAYCSERLQTGKQCERSNGKCRETLNHLAKYLGTDSIISEITPKQLVEYFAKHGMKFMRITMTKSLFEHATHGMYDWHAVRLCKVEGVVNPVPITKIKRKTLKDFIWIEREKMHAAAQRISTEKGGAFWRDAMVIQFHFAARPEELIKLTQDSIVRKDGKIVGLYIAPVLAESGNVVNGLKTIQSECTLPVNDPVVAEALTRRAAEGHTLLFPRIPELCGVRNKLKGGATRERAQERAATDKIFAEKIAFYDKNHGWDNDVWCEQYLKRLRVCAGELGLPNDKIDGRLFRRSRGKEIIDISGSVETAAAWLRDEADTVRTNYARTTPKEVLKGL